jgi:hypothetical protein
MMKRNALIAAGNALVAAANAPAAAGNALATGAWPALRSSVEAIAADAAEDEVVRSTARAVINRLSGTAARS